MGFQHYLGVLRIPHLKKAIDDMYLEPTALPAESPARQESTSIIQSSDDTHHHNKVLIPMSMQPIKIAFHLSPAEGFGEWTVLVSTEAERDLRATNKRDPAGFAIVLKKIR